MPCSAFAIIALSSTFAGPVSFSVPEGLFSDSIEVSLSTGDASATIRYTLDGTLPSPANGDLYAEPLGVASTTQIRAVAVQANPAGEISSAHYIKLDSSLDGYQSNLPILVIENFDAGRIPAKGWNGTGAGIKQKPRQPAMWAIFDRDPKTSMAGLTSAPQMLSRIGIRGRGAFSTTWREPGYSVEAWRNDSDEERKVAPLDIPKHSDWVLYYPHPDQNKDPTMLHNTFMYEMSARLGRYAARFRWVDVFVNSNGGDLQESDRRGVYAIMEKVSRSADRLDFELLSEDGATGGWLLNLNRMDAEYENGWPAPNGATRPQLFHTPGPNRRSQTPDNVAGRGDDDPRQSNGFLNFDNPNGYKINPKQRAAIEDWFVAFENVLYDSDLWKDPVTGYRRYVDVIDFADYFVLHNLGRNGDGLLISMFPWKASRDDRLRMGPVWDFNWSSYDVSGGPTSTLMHRSDRLWYGRLFRDSDFKQLYVDRWFKHRRGVMSNAGIESIIRSQASEIGDANAEEQGVSASTWHRRLDNMESWLTRRADWIDGNYTPVPKANLDAGHVESGTQLTLITNEGAIYYTTDGSDPRAPGGNVSPVARKIGDTRPLMVAGAKSVGFLSVPENADNDESWFALEFNPAAAGWEAAASGVGFDTSDDFLPFISTDVKAAMRGINASVRLRLPFTLTEEERNLTARLVLRVRYDDGFVVFLNGNRIASANAPEILPWNAKATSSHADTAAVVAEEFDLQEQVDLLRTGENVFALQGLNLSAGGSDLLLDAALELGLTQEDPGLRIDQTKRVIARSLLDDDWSAPLDLPLFVDAEPASTSNFALTEIHYHPLDPTLTEIVPGIVNDRNYEFIEFQNTGDRTVDLTGVEIKGGIEYIFDNDSALLSLEPGKFVVVVARTEAFEARYGQDLAVTGEYRGHLSNSGEGVVVRSREGAVLTRVEFGDGDGWPAKPDGTGPSLVRTSGGDPLLAASWSASRSIHGSPGRSERRRFEGNPLEDRDGDGLNALAEFALGTSELDPSDASQATPSIVMSEAAISIVAQVNENAAVAFALHQSIDLLTWSPVSGVVEKVSASGIIRWTIPNPLSTAESVYFRVVITEE